MTHELQEANWMKRLLTEELVKWKHSAQRKPLLVKGVRQCGKTWLLREFGEARNVPLYLLWKLERLLSV